VDLHGSATNSSCLATGIVFALVAYASGFVPVTHTRLSHALVTRCILIGTRYPTRQLRGPVSCPVSLLGANLSVARLTSSIIACIPRFGLLGSWHNPMVSAAERHQRPIGLAIAIIVFGAIGWFASFALTIEKIDVLKNPDYVPSCNFSILVQCGKNLGSWQGSLFGFPNPLIGLGAFVAPIVVGVAILAGARFARWFWVTFNVGMLLALSFVAWLITESIFELNTLCPWCMLVWSITIPMFWLVTLHNLRSGNIPVPERARGFFESAYTWVPLITLGCYLIVAVIAQLRLDVLSYL
jgi:uncharacterized membrane protein